MADEGQDPLDMLVLSERIDASNEVLEQSLHAFLDIISALDKLDTRILSKDQIEKLDLILSSISSIIAKTDVTLSDVSIIKADIAIIRESIVKLTTVNFTKEDKDVLFNISTLLTDIKISYKIATWTMRILIGLITAVVSIYSYLIALGILSKPFPH